MFQMLETPQDRPTIIARIIRRLNHFRFCVHPINSFPDQIDGQTIGPFDSSTWRREKNETRPKIFIPFIFFTCDDFFSPFIPLVFIHNFYPLSFVLPVTPFLPDDLTIFIQNF